MGTATVIGIYLVSASLYYIPQNLWCSMCRGWVTSVSPSSPFERRLLFPLCQRKSIPHFSMGRPYREKLYATRVRISNSLECSKQQNYAKTIRRISWRFNSYEGSPWLEVQLAFPKWLRPHSARQPCQIHISVQCIRIANLALHLWIL